MKRAFLSLAMVAMLTTACTPDGELNEDYNGNQTEQPGDNPDQGNTPEDGSEGDNPDQGGEGGDNPSEGEQGEDGNNDGEGNGDGEGGSDGNEDETPTEQPSEVIEFQDENTKLICTLHWDENEDGELSYEEAAAVTDLGTAFKDSTILAFDELKYFTGITKIRDYAFYNCQSLTSITIPESVTSIGIYAFYDCTELECVTIPNSVTKIGVYAFYNCQSLTSITIPESVTSIGSYAFYDCRSLTSITIPDSVTSIGDKVFRNCTSITSVTIPNSITEIGGSAFDGCTGELLIDSKIIATNYNIDNYPKSSSSAWLYGALFTKLTIGDNITSIGNYAFYKCRSLTSVTIPDCVTKIGVSAFQDCTSLTSAYCKPITPPDWGSNIFNSNGPDFMIYVPRNAVDAYKKSWWHWEWVIEGYDF